MKVTYQSSDVPFEKNSVITVGSFDGMHLAHQIVVEEVVRRAKTRKGRSVLVTFDPHPRQVLAKKSEEVYLLSTVEERKRLCESLGVDLFLVIRFTYDFSRQTFREFYEHSVINGIGVSEVVEGYDHHFGRDREGSVEELLRMGKEFEFSVVVMKPVYEGTELVSSSGIRKHLEKGNVERAAALLGKPYALKGTVVRGDGRGKGLGFPTANVVPASVSKMIPCNGIYLVGVTLPGRKFYGMASIGVRPTFRTDGKRTLEVNILDFVGDLYGTELELEFLNRLREEKKFDSAEELVKQMESDREESLKLVEVHTRVFRLKNKRLS